MSDIVDAARSVRSQASRYAYVNIAIVAIACFSHERDVALPVGPSSSIQFD